MLILKIYLFTVLITLLSGVTVKIYNIVAKPMEKLEGYDSWYCYHYVNIHDDEKKRRRNHSIMTVVISSIIPLLNLLCAYFFISFMVRKNMFNSKVEEDGMVNKAIDTLKPHIEANYPNLLYSYIDDDKEQPYLEVVKFVVKRHRIENGIE